MPSASVSTAANVKAGRRTQAAQRVAQIAAERVEEVVELHAADLQSDASSRRQPQSQQSDKRAKYRAELTR